MLRFSSADLKFWSKTSVFSLVVFITASLYLFYRRGTYTLYIANKTLAVAALVLVGLSLALSAVCYFWDFADKQIIYRKYLGITGFVYALTHTFVSLFLLPEYFSLL